MSIMLINCRLCHNPVAFCGCDKADVECIDCGQHVDIHGTVPCCWDDDVDDVAYIDIVDRKVEGGELVWVKASAREVVSRLCEVEE